MSKSKLDYPRRKPGLYRKADPAPKVVATIQWTGLPTVVPASSMLTTTVGVNTGVNQHGKHKDAEAHRADMRERMRKARAAKRRSTSTQPKGK